MLNPVFAQIGWKPDASATYACSHVTNATGFTDLMVLVMSGRDSVRPHQLARKAELDALLASPESSGMCRQVNSVGWTALTMAVCNANLDSTDDTVAQLLAHESGGDVARMQTHHGWTSLMGAVRYSRYKSTETSFMQLLAHESSRDVTRMKTIFGQTALMVAARYACTDSTEDTFARLLEHESTSDVIHAQDTQGHTALTIAVLHSIRQIGEIPEISEAIVAKLLAHPSCYRILRINTNIGHGLLEIVTSPLYQLSLQRNAVESLVVNALIQTADEQELTKLFYSHPKHVTQYLIDLRQRMSERQTTVAALKAGLSLPGSILLTYI
jgi:ankyrin repeat protein